ncbi:hypothetical protein HDU98_003296 [Podochytrium sp. JEL0797]|nr:hypothetical protein HDU98_003296 [Podochytrium sp. JEL0797]
MASFPLAALDLEWFDQTAGDHLTEIGLAIQSHAGGPVEYKNLIIREHDSRKFRSKSAPSSATGFIFGTKEPISKAYIFATLVAVLRNISTLVLHNGDSDRGVLAKHRIDLSLFPQLTVVDTGTLYQQKSGARNKISLENLCALLGISVTSGSFHNAGNDAAYTLIAFHKLNEATVSSVTELTRMMGQLRTQTSIESLRSSPPRAAPVQSAPIRTSNPSTSANLNATFPAVTSKNRDRSNLLEIPDSIIPFLEGFRDTLCNTTSAVRVQLLGTVDQLKQCYCVYRLFCRQQSRAPFSPNKHGVQFEQTFGTKPIFPEALCEFVGAPSTAVLHLTRTRLLQKYGRRPRNKIAFLVGGLGDQVGSVTKYHNRINVPELQDILSSTAPKLIENDTIGLFSIGQEYSFSFDLHNGYQHPRRLADIVSDEDESTAQLSFCLLVGVPSKNVILLPNSVVTIMLTLTTKHIGYFARRIVFLVDGFRVDRMVRFRVVADAENPNNDFPAPAAPYKPRKIVVDDSEVLAVKGEAPPRPQFEAFKYDLPRYDVPKSVQKLFAEHTDSIRLEQKPASIVKFKQETMNLKNFSAWFHRMLYLEECQMVVDIRAYDQLGEVLTKAGVFLKLDVPGLAENRPSVLYNDKIIVKLASGQKFEGCVHRVELNSVLLKFDKRFHNGIYVNGMQVDVQFNFARTCLRRAHRSLDLLGFVNSQVSSWLLPSNVPLTNAELTRLNSPNALLSNIVKEGKLNEFQVKAISQIASKHDSQTPFVIFGPPGTGKTKTLVESVKVLLATQPTARILVVAPSNAAVDLIVHRLSDQMTGGLPPSQMLRVNAYTRSKESVPHYIERYCRRDESKGIYVIPNTQSALAPYRVVCTTLFTASSLQGMGAFDPIVENGELRNWFTHVMADEVGHATETEFWAGVAGAVSPVVKGLKESQVPLEQRALYKKIAGEFSKEAVKTVKLPQLVIVGDPKQLGPIVRSDLAESCGYSMSYLERLIETCPAYAKNASSTSAENRYEHPHNIVQLVHNYRSHPAILNLYSKTFYGGDLVCCAATDDRLSKLSWLPNREQFPIVFHGVCGKDEREGSSPSWFNQDEAQIVVGYLKSLLHGAPPPFTAKSSLNGSSPSIPNTPGKRAPQGGLFGSAILHIEKSSSLGLTVDDIGIITPYRKQIDKIRLRLNKEGWNRIKVGTVEEFQGDEKKVILLSTVRSSAQWIERDQKFNIGFLRNPKRFNVSISRAKALMIVVGNPDILCGDVHWNELVRYCEENQACVGYPVPIKAPGDRAYRDAVEEDYASEEEEGEVRDVQGVGWRRDE